MSVFKDLTENWNNNFILWGHYHMFIILMDVCKYFYQGDGGGPNYCIFVNSKSIYKKRPGFGTPKPPDPHPPRIGFYFKIDIDICGFN